MGMALLLATALLCRIEAKLLATFDASKAEVYLNGKLVYFEEEGDWTREAVVKIALNEGENLIAVHAFKDMWPAGVLLCLLIPKEAVPAGAEDRWVEILSLIHI